MLEFEEPAGIPPRGTVIVIPGRGEQPEVYRRFGARLAADAYRVHVVSDPAGPVDHTDRSADADPAAGLVRTRGQITDILNGSGDPVPPRPVVIVGSDTGALMAIAESRTLDCDGIVLAGLPPVAAGYAPQSPSWEVELEARTTCPTHRGRISHEIVTRGALYQPIPAALTEWGEPVALAAITVPVLVVHGSADSVSPVAAAVELAGAIPSAETVTVDRARHDVLNDQSHRSVAATVVLWLERLKLHGPALTSIVRHERHDPTHGQRAENVTGAGAAIA